MDEHLVEAIGVEMATLHRRIASTYKKIGKLDQSAYLLLHQITSQGSAGVKTLAEELYLDISTVSRQAAALERKEYVYRVPNPLDGRAYSLQITDLGVKALNDYKHARFVKLAAILENWSHEECKLFGELLSKFNRTSINL